MRKPPSSPSRDPPWQEMENLNCGVENSGGNAFGLVVKDLCAWLVQLALLVEMKQGHQLCKMDLKFCIDGYIHYAKGNAAATQVALQMLNLPDGERGAYLNRWAP